MEAAILVEPQKEHRRKLSDLLKEEGLRVEAFATAEEALKRMEHTTFNLFILDIKTPSGSGLGLLKQLKDRDLSVLLITSNLNAAIKHDLYSLGEVVQGPVSDQDMKARVRGILMRARTSRRHEREQVASHPIAAHVLPELHDPGTGRLDAGRIAEFLGIPLTAFSKFTDMSVAGLHKSPASVSLQQHLIPIARSLTILTQLLGSKEGVRTWMNSPHPDLGGRTPIAVIEERKSRAVLEMLESALAGQPS